MAITTDNTEERRARCEDCDERFTEDQLVPADDLADRVAPGEIVPAGQCPTCGSLCHLDPMPIPPGTTLEDLERWRLERLPHDTPEERFSNAVDLARLRAFAERVRNILQDEQKPGVWMWEPERSGADVIMDLTEALNAAGFTAEDGTDCPECGARIAGEIGVSTAHEETCSLYGPDAS
jgi:DNA-directed RNA polymerase subunit RPC12/RpoP